MKYWEIIADDDKAQKSLWMFTARLLLFRRRGWRNGSIAAGST
jgi:hypothetical protein